MNALRIWLAGCFLVIALAGCRQEVGTDEGIGMRGEIDALLQADRDFGALSETEGYIEAYYRFSAEEVLLLPPGTEPRSGREDIYRDDSLEGLLGNLAWEPEDGSVALSGDLGWTWGRWVFTVVDHHGNSQQSYGKYVFLWRKTDGQWKMTVNIWNENPEP